MSRFMYLKVSTPWLISQDSALESIECSDFHFLKVTFPMSWKTCSEYWWLSCWPETLLPVLIRCRHQDADPHFVTLKGMSTHPMSWPHLRLSTLKNICLSCQTWLSKVWDGLSKRKYIRVSIIKFTLWKSTSTLFIPYFKLIFILPFRVQLLAASSFKKSNLHLNRNCFNHLASQKSKHFIHSSFFFPFLPFIVEERFPHCAFPWLPWILSSMDYRALPPHSRKPLPVLLDNASGPGENRVWARTESFTANQLWELRVFFNPIWKRKFNSCSVINKSANGKCTSKMAANGLLVSRMLKGCSCGILQPSYSVITSAFVPMVVDLEQIRSISFWKKMSPRISFLKV